MFCVRIYGWWCRCSCEGWLEAALSNLGIGTKFRYRTFDVFLLLRENSGKTQGKHREFENENPVGTLSYSFGWIAFKLGWNVPSDDLLRHIWWILDRAKIGQVGQHWKKNEKMAYISTVLVRLFCNLPRMLVRCTFFELWWGIFDRAEIGLVAELWRKN